MPLSASHLEEMIDVGGIEILQESNVIDSEIRVVYLKLIQRRGQILHGNAPDAKLRHQPGIPYEIKHQPDHGEVLVDFRLVLQGVRQLSVGIALSTAVVVQQEEVVTVAAVV